MNDIDDAELERIALRVRAHRRKTVLARAVGAGITLVGLVFGMALAFALDVGRLTFLGLLAGGLVGAVAMRALEPKDSIDDL